MDIFTQIKERLPIVDVLAAYGVKSDLHNRVLCPFHLEDTPSLVIYPDTGSFYCFGCCAGGDAVSFVGKLFNLDPLQAAQKLNTDFRLGIEAGSPPDMEQIRTAQDNRETVKNFEAWISGAYGILCDYFHMLQNFKANYAPDKPGVMDFRYIEAAHNLPYIEYLIDTLLFADFETKVEFYKLYNEEVAALAARITAHRTNRNTKTA